MLKEIWDLTFSFIKRIFFQEKCKNIIATEIH